MEQNIPKKLAAEACLNEVWTAGGPVWLNLANTTALARKGLTDVMESSDSFRWWLRIMGLPSPSSLTKEDLLCATELRASFSRAIHSIANGTLLASRDLKLFNLLLQSQHKWFELEQSDSGVVLKRSLRSAETIEQVLGPAVESLSDTLVDGDPTRLRTCAHPDCELAFYDDSKNGARRWCTMSGCGNRAKAAAHLQRKKSSR